MTSECGCGNANDRHPHMSYRQYMLYKTILDGIPIWAATEAVATTALAHPEWPTDLRTWSEWEMHDRPR